MTELTYPDIEKALDKMTKQQRMEVEMLATDLQESIRRKSNGTRKSMLGRQGALELIAKLGIFMNTNDWNGEA